MYIYRIINNINGKSYIGSTKDTKERFKQHIKSSKYSSSQSYNYPLQRAFRKYGIENFSFTIIEEYNRRYIFYNNEWTLVSKVAEQKGLKPAIVMARIRRGWTKERALEL